MTFTVSITSQGQISIPAVLRRMYGLDKLGKVLIYPGDGGKIVIEPIEDIFSLKGALKTTKKISSAKIRKEFEKYLATRHLR